MRKLSIFCLFVIMCQLALVDNLHGQLMQVSTKKCLESNRDVITKLDKNNFLYKALQQNEEGDGIFFSWMENMKKVNIKQATAEVYFNMKNNDINLKINKISFFSSYYSFNSKIERSNLDTEAKLKILDDELKIFFYIETLKTLKDIEVKNNSCGNLYLNLLDDACLPILNEIPYIETKCG